MGLPPATPTPSSRFLVTKKSCTSSAQTTHPHQYQTPGAHQQYGTNAPRQFYATPRFSSSAKPPPSSDKVTWGPVGALTTPVLLKPKTPRNTRSTRDIIDSSPPLPDDLGRPLPDNQVRELPEPIELPSSLIPESSPPEPPEFEIERPTKRRRISITSIESESDIVSFKDVKDEPDDFDLIPASSFPDDDVDEETLVKRVDENDDICEIKDDELGHNPSLCSSDEEALEAYYFPGHKRGGDLISGAHQRPIFFNPPSFVPLNPTESAPENHALPPDHLADIFSPSKRKGARYVSGGLAAELRDWLVDVKTESEKRVSSAAIARLTIDNLRNSGPGITLISGNLTPPAVMPDSEAPEFRAILVGEGGLVNEGDGGLEDQSRHKQKTSVSAGDVVGVAPPAWDIDLPGQGRWSVAYRWDVMSNAHQSRPDG
ncbi:hypothetical protein V8F33_002084 [Rhypophila sp. PSN 637]